MIEINDFKEERSCVFKGEEYLVRDNGAVLRKTQPQGRPRKLDNLWTFGKLNTKTGYLEIATVRIHRIVATAFHGNAPTNERVVDHIDTNRQNNRPENLRWITRLENVVLNPITRKRIEYRTGVSIDEFLKNPIKYRNSFSDPDFSWMRRVSEEEAKQCLINMQKWGESKKQAYQSSLNRIGDWIYSSHIASSINRMEESFNLNNIDLTESLTPLAKQRDWRTPVKFPCCPEKIFGEPIECYFKNMYKDKIFNTSKYGDSIIKDFAKTNNEIIVIVSIPSSVKSFALSKVVFENGYYIHENLGSFFTYEGAEKQFTLAQGLEWNGGDSIDDYC